MPTDGADRPSAHGHCLSHVPENAGQHTPPVVIVRAGVADDGLTIAFATTARHAAPICRICSMILRGDTAKSRLRNRQRL